MKPILFNTEMVKAILDGRKTVTRRHPFKFEMKPGYNPDWSGYSLGEYYTGHINSGVCLYSRGTHDVWGVRSNVVKPKYKVGEILYVRETWSTQYDGIHDDNGYGIYVFKADGTRLDNSEGISSSRWYPSIHMPKEAAKIFLRVKEVRVERLHDITEKQAWKEGVFSECEKCHDYKSDECRECANQHEAYFRFSDLWDSTVKKADLDRYGWQTNPWVWVIEFERISKEEADKEL